MCVWLFVREFRALKLIVFFQTHKSEVSACLLESERILKIFVEQKKRDEHKKDLLQKLFFGFSF